MLFLACAGGLAYSAVTFHRTPPPPAPTMAAAPAPRQLQVVRGQVSPDKVALMADGDVKSAFSDAGLSVEIGTTPGRDMIERPSPDSQYVFSWPTDDETAAMVVRSVSRNPWARSATAPFYTTPVLLAWRPAADALARAGMVRGRGRWRTLDVRALVEAMTSGRRWSDVAHGGEWTSDRPLQVRMPDLDRSGTATTFLAIASQAANGGRNVGTRDEARKVADRLSPLFRLQGTQPATVTEAIAEFSAFGISRTPLLLLSEADAVQFLQGPHGADDVTVLYPDQTVVSPQTLVPYTLMGQRVARLLSRPAVRRAALRHGFRIAGVADVPGAWSDPADAPPRTFQTILEMPQTDLVEAMIERIDGRDGARTDDAARQPPAAEERQKDAAPARKAAGSDVRIQEPRDPDEELPPSRPIVDPDADAETQQAAVQDYVRKLRAYRSRQDARAAVAERQSQ
jgi:hypothetical protein